MNLLFSIAMRTENKEVEIAILTTDPGFQAQVDLFDRQALAKKILAAVHEQVMLAAEKMNAPLAPLSEPSRIYIPGSHQMPGQI